MKPPQRAEDPRDYEAAFLAAQAQVAAVHAAQPASSLPHWVVFGPRTSDHPGLFLARLWLLRPIPAPTQVLLRAGTLTEIRALLPEGLARLPREAADDPNILETWL